MKQISLRLFHVISVTSATVSANSTVVILTAWRVDHKLDAPVPPGGPTEPGGPPGPMSPPGPAGPSSPGSPCGPFGPGAPRDPCWPEPPVAPSGPLGPGGPATQKHWKQRDSLQELPLRVIQTPNLQRHRLHITYINNDDDDDDSSSSSSSSNNNNNNNNKSAIAVVVQGCCYSCCCSELCIRMNAWFSHNSATPVSIILSSRCILSYLIMK